ncbi:MAG: outer membrane beta-barrel protein [Bacteroidota bacterium]
MSGAYLAIRFVPTVPVRTGIDVKVRLTNKLYLSTGVQYDFVVQKIEESHIWVAPGGGLSKFKYKTTMGYFEVPLRIDLRFSKTRFSTFLTAGGYAGVFFRGKSTYENTNINGIPYQYSTDFRYNSNASLRSQMYSNLQLGYGLDVNLNQLKFQFFPFYEAGWLEIGGEYFYRHRLGAALSVLYGF